MSTNTSPLTIPIDISRSPSPCPIFEGNLYFGYGSNMWHHQVQRRCPNARFVGIARLRHWRWQINSRGYANIVEAPQEQHHPNTAKWLGPLMGDDTDLRHDNLRTYGMVWELSDADMKVMDGYEDVPASYTKEEAFIELWPRREGQAGKTNILRRAKRVKATFYCDRENVQDSNDKIFRAYSYKMNQAIADGLELGIPEGYINTCIRPFVADVEDGGVAEALKEAMLRGVDVKRLVEKVEDELAVSSIKTETEGVSKADLKEYFKSMIGEDKTADATDSETRRRALSSRW